MTNDEWLKQQCSRYNVDGFCSITRCLLRGGVDVSKLDVAWPVAAYRTACESATCHAHEVMQELESLRALQIPEGSVAISRDVLASLRRSASPVTENPSEDAFYDKLEDWDGHHG